MLRGDIALRVYGEMQRGDIALRVWARSPFISGIATTEDLDETLLHLAHIIG